MTLLSPAAVWYGPGDIPRCCVIYAFPDSDLKHHGARQVIQEVISTRCDNEVESPEEGAVFICFRRAGTDGAVSLPREYAGA